MTSLLKVVRTTGLLKAVTNAPLAQVGGVRQFSVTAAGRAGVGVPVPAHEPPTSPVVEENELTWDGGDANPEPALDSLPPHIVGMRESPIVSCVMCTWARYTRAAMMLAGGLGFYFSVFNFAKYMDKPSQQPFTDKVFPFDNLKEELGGGPAPTPNK